MALCRSSSSLREHELLAERLNPSHWRNHETETMLGSVETSININALLFLAVILLVVLAPSVVALMPQHGKKSRPIALALLPLSMLLLAFAAFALDAVLGLSASWAFIATTWAVGSLVCLAVWWRCKSKIASAIGVMFTAFLLALHFFDFLPVKPFKRFFDAIKPGMTEQEVLTLLHREFPQPGWLSPPVRRDQATNEMDFYLGQTAEGVFVRLDNGRVVDKQYSRD